MSDPNLDESKRSISNRYNQVLSRFEDKTQLEIFSEVTKKCTNIKVIMADSMEAHLPTGNIAFAVIDGTMNPKYVKNDFHLICNKLSSHGIIAF